MEREIIINSIEMDDSLQSRMELIKKENTKFFRLHSEANEIWAKLVEITSVYQGGMQSLAAQQLYKLCYSDITKIATSALSEKQMLFRMRCSGDKFQEYSEEEMFHIPFEKNYLVGNERFSLSGFPSLYLGESSYVCWEELRHPNLENVTLAIFQAKQYVKVIDLTYDGKSTISNPLKHCLFLASTIPVLHKDAPFKPEYIIPQLLLQGLVTYKNENYEKATDYAIKYTSTHSQDKGLWFGNSCNLHKKLTNYVFAPLCYQEVGVSNSLKCLLECKGSINYTRFKLCIDKAASMNSNEGQSSYDLSAFGKLENYLKLQAKTYGMLTYDGLVKGMLTST